MARSTSYYYWRKREVYNDLTYQKKEAEYTKELNKIYDYAQDQIQKEIDRFYGKYAFEEGITMAEARKRVSQLDIDEYSRKAQKYVKEKDFSKRANEEMRLYNATMKINRLEMLKSKIGLELTVAANDADRYMEEILRSRVNEEYRRQSGILGESIGTNVKDVNSLINASFHNATWSERVWTNQRLLRAELDKLLNTAMIQGKGSRALAQDLHKAMGGAKYNAERLMRTELKRVTSDSQLRSFEEAGFQEYMFMTLSSAPFSPSKVCPICAELNGKTFKIKDAVVGENLPPMHPNCRCSVTAYEGDEDYLDLFRELDLNEADKAKYMQTALAVNGSSSKASAQEHDISGKLRSSIERLLKNKVGFKSLKGIKNIDGRVLIVNASQLNKLEKIFGAVKSLEWPRMNAEVLEGNFALTAQNELRLLDQHLALNISYYDDLNTLLNVTRACVKEKYVMPCLESKLGAYFVTHEYGHMLNNILLSKELPSYSDFYKRYRGENLPEDAYKLLQDEVIMRYNKEIEEIAVITYPDLDVDSQLSTRAKLNVRERFAETFANSFCGDPNALGEAMIIWLRKRGYKI